jgi:hypothetical protein
VPALLYSKTGILRGETQAEPHRAYSDENIADISLNELLSFGYILGVRQLSRELVLRILGPARVRELLVLATFLLELAEDAFLSISCANKNSFWI